jgi:hypothetical protein
MSLEQFLENITLEELEELKRLKESRNSIPTYSFSKIKFSDIESLVEIKQIFLDSDRFSFWFGANIAINRADMNFLKRLIESNLYLINLYSEEDLKINFIAPLIKRVDFFMLESEIRDFFNEKLTYKTDKFIFTGETDFVVSKGIKRATNPYFFIQEFKRGFENTNPEPQLLAEMISAIELNSKSSMKGAYIIGENWTFVIVEKLQLHRYNYYVSRTFNSTKIEDLKSIYKNLLFIKNEIIEMVKKEEYK